MSRSKLGICLLFFLCLISAGKARADGPTLVGEWSATALNSRWAIGDWGDACGPRPSGGGVPGGTVTIRQSGVELVMTGAGRTYSTTECWEQFPGLGRVSHSASARSFRNVCKTPPNDPRQATVITNVTATDTRITLDETGQYQFVIEGQNCTASVRRTRFLTLVHREGETTEPAPATAARAPVAAPEPEPKARPCSNPGEPARLEVRPSRKLLRGGETFSFRASVLDRSGCALKVMPEFRLVGTPRGVDLIAAGTIHVSDDAPEGEVKLMASVDNRSVSVVAEIVSSNRYDSLLQQGAFDATGESAEAAVTRIESSSIGARGAVLKDSGEQRKRIFVALAGSAAILLGIMGLVAVRRSRRQELRPPAFKRAGGPHAGAAPQPPPPSASPAPKPPPPTKAPTAKVCPTCRQEYPPEAQFCANDGNRVVPLVAGPRVMPGGGVCPVCGQGYDPGVATCPKHDEPLVPAAVAGQGAERLGSVKKICPMCGAQYAGDNQFCGNCGGALVPVN